MRICMLAYSCYESDGRIMRYAETLAARGDEVEVIALRQKNQPVEAEVGCVKVFRIQERTYDERSKLTYLWKILAFLIRSSFWLGKRHLKNSFHVVHVHSVPDFLVLSAWLPHLSGAKIVLDIHDILPELYASKFNKGEQSSVYKLLLLVERISAALADHVIIANHLWQEKITRRSIAKAKCTVVLNHPDPTIFYPRPVQRRNEKFVMIYPGTLNRHQGLDVAIRAFALVAEQIPEAEFHIYGRGAAQEELQSLTRTLGVQNKVLFRDFLPIRRIAQVMARADLAIEPKRSGSFSGQALSTKIMEFMALGVPVIVSGTEVHRYYFDDSVVKFFPPENEKALAESILFLRANPDTRSQLVRTALEYIKQQNWEMNKHHYLALLDSLSGVKRTDHRKSA